MAETKTKIFPPSISSSLARRDYRWIEITPEEFAEMLAKKLKEVKAKAWMLDVYCFNNQVHRNLEVKWISGHLAIQFNREEGTIINVIDHS